MHGAAFDKPKSILLTIPVLKYYDITKPVTLQCDTSQKGMGAYILLDGQPIEYASCILIVTE